MLFKILHGDKSRISTEITPYHEGYCYVTHDGDFYVDMNNERVKLNAKDAETLMGLTVEEILTSSQADWSVNDETSPAYIKNRTHYKYTQELVYVNENNITLTSGENYYYSNYSIDVPPSLEDTVHVIFNGITYDFIISKARADDYCLFAPIGDNFDDIENNTPVYGFCIEFYQYGGCLMSLYTAAETVNDLKISVDHNMYTQLPEEYISYKPGKIVSGQMFIVDGEEIVAYDGAEIFNDYTNNVSVGYYAHAEGEYTVASGDVSHAEGYETIASGRYSHTSGRGTAASYQSEYVFGEYNVYHSAEYCEHVEDDILTISPTLFYYFADNYTFDESTGLFAFVNPTAPKQLTSDCIGKYFVRDLYDPSQLTSMEQIISSTGTANKYNVKQYYRVQPRYSRGKYVHTVGNGTSDAARSNAHTLDWGGNAWFAGSVKVGGTSQDDAKELATQEYVNTTNGVTVVSEKLSPSEIQKLTDGLYYFDEQASFYIYLFDSWSEDETAYVSEVYVDGLCKIASGYIYVYDLGTYYWISDIRTYDGEEHLCCPAEYAREIGSDFAGMYQLSTRKIVNVRLRQYADGIIEYENDNNYIEYLRTFGWDVSRVLTQCTVHTNNENQDVELYEVEKMILDDDFPYLYGIKYVGFKDGYRYDVVCEIDNITFNKTEIITQAYVDALIATLRPKHATVSLPADGWVGNASPYHQVVEIEGVTEYSQVDLKPSAEQLSIFRNKDIAFVAENEGGIVTVYVIGDKPANDYTMQVAITEVTV